MSYKKQEMAAPDNPIILNWTPDENKTMIEKFTLKMEQVCRNVADAAETMPSEELTSDERKQLEEMLMRELREMDFYP